MINETVYGLNSHNSVQFIADCLGYNGLSLHNAIIFLGFAKMTRDGIASYMQDNSDRYQAKRDAVAISELLELQNGGLTIDQWEYCAEQYLLYCDFSAFQSYAENINA